MNGFTPEMFEGISGAFEMLEQDSNLWVGVLCFAGKHSTAGLVFSERIRGPARKPLSPQTIGPMHLL